MRTFTQERTEGNCTVTIHVLLSARMEPQTEESEQLAAIVESELLLELLRTTDPREVSGD